MNCWDTLAIAPTTDLKLIKKAYAKLLKQIDQEADPQAFMALRDAFEQAQYEAQYILSDEDDDNAYSRDIAQDNDLSSHDEHLIHPDDALNNIEQSDTLTKDPNKVIEYSYHQFEQQLQLKDQNFNLYLALADIRIQLEQLDLDTQADYLQRFKALLSQYDLESFQEQLNTKTSKEFKHYVYSKAESESANAENDILDVSVQDQFSQDLEQIVASIRSQDFSNDQFQRFKQLITEVQDLSFEQQLEFKTRVMYVLAEMDRIQDEEKFVPFIALWQQYFPWEDDCLNQNYYEQQVQQLVKSYQQRIQIYQHQAQIYQDRIQIYQQLSPKNQKAYLQLTENQGFQPWQMLWLNMTLNQQFKSSNYLGRLEIAHRASNANFLYLYSIKHGLESLWLILIVLCGSIYYFSNYSYTIPQLKVLLLSLLVIWCVFIQLPIKVLLLSHPYTKSIQLHLNQFWFLSGIILMTVSPYMNATVHQSLTYIWLLLTVFIFSVASTVLPNVVRRLFAYPQKIVVDGIAMTLTALIFTVGFSVLMTMTSNLYLSIAFMMMPIGFVLFPAYFQPMYQRLSFRTNKDLAANEVDRNVVQRNRLRKALNLFCVALMGGGFFTLVFWLSGATSISINISINLALSIFCYLSVFLLAFKPNIVPYVYKYLSYISLMIVFAYTMIFPMILLYFMFLSAQQDLQTDKR